MTAPRFLTARYDVTGLAEVEVDALAGEVTAMAERSDAHPTVEAEVTLDPDPAPESPREVLVHLNVEVPHGDDRDPNQIADAILAALEVGSDDDSVRGLVVVCPLADEV